MENSNGCESPLSHRRYCTAESPLTACRGLVSIASSQFLGKGARIDHPSVDNGFTSLMLAAQNGISISISFSGLEFIPFLNTLRPVAPPPSSSSAPA